MFLKLLRLFSILDGLSFLVLLYFSYVKRAHNAPDVVRIPGIVHAAIFIVFLVLLYLTMEKRKWPLKRAALVFVCSLIPIAPFFLEASLKREQADTP